MDNFEIALKRKRNAKVRASILRTILAILFVGLSFKFGGILAGIFSIIIAVIVGVIRSIFSGKIFKV